MDSTTYQDSNTQSNYFQVRTQRDFYYTKWSDYKKPEWYHPYNGRDWRSEYLYTKREDEFSGAFSPRILITVDFCNKYRAYLYLGLFALSQLYAAYLYFREQDLESKEMEILESSF